MVAHRSTITAILAPDADGTWPLLISRGLRHWAIRVKAELEPALPEGSQRDVKGLGCVRGRISMGPDFVSRWRILKTLGSIGSVGSMGSMGSMGSIAKNGIFRR